MQKTFSYTNQYGYVIRLQRTKGAKSMKHDHPTPDADPLADYTPVTLRRTRHDGWTAERQRTFLLALAETGCISVACEEAGITTRSAYRLRHHPSGAPFAEAWDQALRFATARLMTLAYERSIRGSIREQWRDGKLVGEVRQPSDRLLALLLTHLAPWNAEPGTRWARLNRMAHDAGAAFTPMLDALEDSPVPADPLTAADFAAPAIPRGQDPEGAPIDLDETW
jgi:hypothetical protein